MPHFTRFARVVRSRPVAAIAAAIVLGACSDKSTTEPVAQDDAARYQRLFVADASQPSARLIAIDDHSTVTSFNLSAPASAVVASQSRRFAVAMQSAANTVEFFDGGVWAEGTGAQAIGYRRTPQKLSFKVDGGIPSHENVNAHWIALYFDGTGSGKWVDERDLIAATPRVAFELNTGGPHHSAAATLVTTTNEFFAYGELNPNGGNPNTIVVKNRQGQELARNADCPSMHGTGSNKDGVVFGCTDGAMLVRASGNAPTITKLTPSGELAGLGVRSVWAERDGGFLVARMSTPSGVTPSRRVLVTIDPVAGAMAKLPLPDGTVEHAVAVDTHSGKIVVLANNGTLFILDGASRTLQTSIANAVPSSAFQAPVKAHGIAVAENVAFVASPTTGKVLKVDLKSGTIVEQITVSGEPSRIALLGATRAGQYRRAGS